MGFEFGGAGNMDLRCEWGVRVPSLFWLPLTMWMRCRDDISTVQEMHVR